MSDLRLPFLGAVAWASALAGFWRPWWVMVGAAVVALPLGILADRWSKKVMMAVAIAVSALGGFLLSLVRTIPLLALTGFLWQAFALAASIASATCASVISS